MSFFALSLMFQFQFLQYWLPRRYLLIQSQQQRHQHNVWNWFKVNNKGNGTTSITSMLPLLLTLNRLFWSLCRSLFWSSHINLKFLLLSLKKFYQKYWHCTISPFTYYRFATGSIFSVFFIFTFYVCVFIS